MRSTVLRKSKNTLNLLVDMPNQHIIGPKPLESLNLIHHNRDFRALHNFRGDEANTEKRKYGINP